MSYTSQQRAYIASVDGAAHQSAVEIIGTLEAQLAEARALLVEADAVLGSYGRFHPLADKRPTDLRDALKALLVRSKAEAQR